MMNLERGSVESTDIGVRGGASTLTVEWFTKVNNLVSLCHCLRNVEGKGKVASYLSDGEVESNTG
jgi:hypothetical protein